jgi:DnaJ-class molecular chaperone
MEEDSGGRIMKAQLCPKCNGQGIVSRPPWVPGDVAQWSSPATSYPCDVCKGLKIIYVPERGSDHDQI